MSAGELLNKLVDVTLCGKTYKIRRLSVVELLAVVSDYVRADKMKNVKAAMELLDKAEQAKFLIEQMNALPVGIELEAQARILLGDDMPEEVAFRILFAALTDQHPELTFNDAVCLYKDTDTVEALKTFYLIAGKNIDAPDTRNSKSLRKHSSGRRPK